MKLINEMSYKIVTDRLRYRALAGVTAAQRRPGVRYAVRLCGVASHLYSAQHHHPTGVIYVIGGYDAVHALLQSQARYRGEKEVENSESALSEMYG